MTETRPGGDEMADPAAEIEQLRARISDLERQLRSARRNGGSAATPTSSNGALKAVAGGLAVTTGLMAAPAFITVRRWVRWWR